MPFLIFLLFLISQSSLANDKCITTGQQQTITRSPQQSFDEIVSEANWILSQRYSSNILHKMNERSPLFNMLLRVKLYDEAISRLTTMIKPTQENLQFRFATVIPALINSSLGTHYLQKSIGSRIVVIPYTRISFINAFEGDTRHALSVFKEIYPTLNSHLGFESLGTPFMIADNLSLPDFLGAGLTFNRELTTVSDFFSFSSIAQHLSEEISPYGKELESIWSNTESRDKSIKTFQRKVALEFFIAAQRTLSKQLLNSLFKVVDGLNSFAENRRFLSTQQGVKKLIANAKTGKVSLLADLIFLEGKFEFMQTTSHPQALEHYSVIALQFLSLKGDNFNELNPKKIEDLLVKIKKKMEAERSKLYRTIHKSMADKVDEFNRSQEKKDATALAKASIPLEKQKVANTSPTQKKKKKKTRGTPAPEIIEVPEHFLQASQAVYTVEPATLLLYGEAKKTLKTAGSNNIQLRKLLISEIEKIKENPLNYGISEVNLPPFLKFHKFNSMGKPYRIAFIYYSKHNILEILSAGKRGGFYDGDYFESLRSLNNDFLDQVLTRLEIQEKKNK